MKLISIYLVIFNHILHITSGNPINNEESHSTGHESHIDITTSVGVGFEEGAEGHVYVHGLRFPQNSFDDGDSLSFQFKTKKSYALLFHGVSHLDPDGEQLTAYLQNGTVRVRLQGNCGWLVVSDVAVLTGVHAADGHFHSLFIRIDERGMRIQVDDGSTRWLQYSRSPFFRCFKIQKLYFGKRNAFQNASLRNNYAELGYPMTGCIRSFRTGLSNNQSDDTNQQIKASYSKISSCHLLPRNPVDS